MSILCLVENACWLLWILNNVNWLCSLSSCSCHWITYREKLTQGQWNAIKNTACNLGKTVDWSMSWAVFYFSVLKYVMLVRAQILNVYLGFKFPYAVHCRVVTYKTGKTLADSWKAAFFESSAKENSVSWRFNNM